MSAERIQVRRKEVKTASKLPIYAGVFLVAAILVGVGLYFFVSGSYAGAFPAELETSVEGSQKVIKVPKNGDLQKAIDQAQGGDIIELQAGVSYPNIVLPKKNISEFITIRSSSASQLPPDKRVTPEQVKVMARIATRGGKPAVETKDGAHHYRFVGIEFVSEDDQYVYNLVYLAASTDKREDIPHTIEIDRCYIRSGDRGISRRGIAVNSADTIIKNSYIKGFAYQQQETQGICGWTGTKNVKIINNHIEGGAENILFGGSDPANADLVPQDIEITGNYLYKPADWKGLTVKTLFELKNSKNVKLVGNYLRNNWEGSAFRITIRNQDGAAPFSTIEDVLIKDNIIENSGDGFNILGTDDTHKSLKLKRLKIVNNLLLDIGKDKSMGSGYFLQISSGEDILIANNTVFNYGNIATMHGEMPKDLVIRDNIVAHSEYGIHGYPAIRSAAGQKLFSNNVVVNTRRVDESSRGIPVNNFWVSNYEEVGFQDIAARKFDLKPGSKYRSAGSEGSQIGCDVSKLPFELGK